MSLTYNNFVTDGRMMKAVVPVFVVLLFLNQAEGKDKWPDFQTLKPVVTACQIDQI